MLKTFTLDRIVDEQLTETEGKRTFHITDETGFTRTVWGTTLLNENKQVVSIAANKKREHPLIQCLADAVLKETISIEFTQYNAVFGRDDRDPSKQTIDDIAKEMQDRPMRIDSLISLTEVS